MVRKTSKVVAEPKAWALVGLSFQMIFKNWKLFLPLVLIGLIVAFANMGASMDTLMTFGVLTFLVIWLTSLFFARHLMAGHKIKLRDGLYNAMTPLISTLIIYIVLALECVPIALAVIGYSAAIETELFSNMFYGSVFVIFAVAMAVISLWLLSQTAMALIAVTTPGMYPGEALKKTYEIMKGRRMKLVIKMLVLALVFVIFVAVTATPIAVLANIIGNATVVTVGIFVEILTGSFMTIFAAVYLYMYYRWLIGMDENE